MAKALSKEEIPLQEVSSREEMLKEMGEWASRYEIVAAMGYLALLLTLGKAINNLGKITKFRFTPPAAVIAGFIGLALTDTIGAFSSMLQVELVESLRSIEANLVNFVFTALILGFTTVKTKLTLKRVLGTVWHEGMPMLLYAQALIWGNSCFALGIVGIYRLVNKSISKYEGGLVTLGLEAGRDILPSRVKFKEESLAVVHLADSAGLTISIIVGVLLVIFRRVSPNRKQEWLGVGAYGTKDSGPLTSREHFSRNVPSEGEGVAMQRRIFSFQTLEEQQQQALVSGAADTDTDNEGPTGGAVSGGEGAGGASASAPSGASGVKVARQGEEAALGTHIGLIALSVFFGYLLNLSLKFVELNREFLRNHHLISGIRLFKICMLAAVGCVLLARRLTTIRFKSDWFHRLAGFSLDLMATAAISSIRFDYYKKVQNVELVVLTILGCVLWNLIAFFAFAKRMFPNFWYARGVTLMGDALGHSWVGLLLARALDPQLTTPVPLAFTYKLLVFFVPGSGGKNTIVIGLIDVFGEWVTFLICVLMLWFWMHIFDRYYKRRWPKDVAAAAAAASALSRAEKYGERHESSDDVDIELLPMVGPPPMRAEAEDLPGLPTLSEPSIILSKQQIRKLVGCLPDRDAMRNWVKVYCMSRDGASLSTLLYNAMSHKKAASFLIVIEDSWGYIFGGYVACPFKNSNAYYGTGESFVYKFHPEFTLYRWTGANDYFVLSNPQHLAMGGGGGFAFQLDDELDTGVSGPSETFGNTRLSSRGLFKALNLEIYVFETYTEIPI